MATAGKFSIIGCNRDSSAASGFTVFNDNAELEVFPSSVKCEHEVGSISYNNIRGWFMDRPVFRKRKLVWKFDGFSNGNTGLKAIVDLVDYNLKTHGSRFYKLNGWVPGYGWVDGYFYLGTPFTLDSYGYSAPVSGMKSGNPTGVSTELHFIEAGNVDTDLATTI